MPPPAALRASVVHFDRLSGLQSLQGGAVVVIDVLRATTVIASALAHGADAVVPVSEVDVARRIAGSIEGALLGGEEHNVKLPGFDFGNSPQEYDARVACKTVVMRTTNGTRALDALRESDPLWCGAFANAGSIVRAVRASGVTKVTFVCAGQAGEFSLEDFACAGAFLDGLNESGEVACDDEAIAARELFRGHRHALAALLRNGNHAKALERAGFGSDVEFCAKLDRYDVLPAFADGSLTASSLGAVGTPIENTRL
jgi:2-phosphosulfolactate phosphatase